MALLRQVFTTLILVLSEWLKTLLAVTRRYVGTPRALAQPSRLIVGIQRSMPLLEKT